MKRLYELMEDKETGATQHKGRCDNQPVKDVLGVAFNEMAQSMKDMKAALLSTGYVKL